MKRLLGVLQFTVHKCNNLKWVESKERGGTCRGVLSKTTCHFCRCGGADLCCGKADPFVTIDGTTGPSTDDQRRIWRYGVSNTINNNSHPVFDFDCNVLLDHFYDKGAEYPALLVRVWDDDFAADIGADLLGITWIPFSRIAVGPVRRETFKLVIGNVDSQGVGEVQISYRFRPFDLESNSLPLAHFRTVTNNAIELYHDAHAVGNLPIVEIEDGIYDNRGCWKRIHSSMKHAKHLIFIVGWSVNVDVKLRRGGKPRESLGQLLLRKAEEGVNVAILIWDDYTSSDFYQTGLMGTSDEKTYNFFKHSSVLCRRVPRITKYKNWFHKTTTKALFTHHQKVITVDVPSTSHPEKRCLGTYWGGLDLTNGRYDTCDHKLFSDLDTTWQDDFYNGCLPSANAEVGPREPWHDVHAFTRGPVAWQFLRNFQERCVRQAPEFINCIDRILAMKDRGIIVDDIANAANAFSVQVLRSVDSISALLASSDFTRFFTKSSSIVDRSIQHAYVYHIAKAKRFVYIENQYFLGSCQMWMDAEVANSTPCPHLVPQSIVHRIWNAIEKQEDFHVYVTIPLFPEGHPESGSVQEILFFQFQTIRSMCIKVQERIDQMGLHATPDDYLSVFFLGQRDSGPGDVIQNANARIARAVLHKRHQIYVHSKLMIVDDEYLLLGSANINQRSMDGARDTEIAAGMWQPTFKVVKEGTGWALPKGYIYGFRQSLFAEHLGQVFPQFSDLGSLRCSRFVRTLARLNFETFTDEENDVLPHGQLCLYPYAFEEGDLVPTLKTLPDTDAKVTGHQYSTFLNICTT
ncbi:MAG: uncharacterized protein KVP18_002366 [Porospora cf. gigantea A]|uniref:uncharacterized protein n=1 Tax=Porospora cf. gigantea A TaxID=2853593 RepID=UPI003559BB25|nr:MAG: hypothetical protein KVP18_002366 [Porospora cf. gigantea A]